ncbi:matrixin family metalloprotease [Paraburkholderia sediminicola]|uniref:matrixin family metalloprotease n=1 Tax=Paraburkholderia sediminicola TaxID=458836 RepID=UPI0038BDA0E4
MSSVTVAGFTVSNLDNVASVSAAAQQYTNDETTGNWANYQAALANAAAAATSLIPGEGSVFAGNAIMANIVNLSTNFETMSANNVESAYAAIAGELVTMVGQGIEVAGLAGTNINPIVGGGIFTLGELVNAVGFIATAVGAGVDLSAIENFLSQDLQAAGFVPDSNGNFTPGAQSSSTFICDASNASTMFDIAQGNNTDQILPQDMSFSVVNDSPVATVIANPLGQDIIIAPGVNGARFNLDINGGSSSVSGVNSAILSGGQYNFSGPGIVADISNGQINVGSGTTLNLSGSGDVVNQDAGSDVSVGAQGVTTIENSLTGQDITISNGNISIAGDDAAISGGATASVSIDSDGSSSVALLNAAGAETVSEQFNSAGDGTGIDNYAGTSTGNYETGAVTLSTTTGWETSDTEFNSAGQETAYVTYGGAADSAGIDPYTGFITFASNGAETSSEQFNSSGVETGVINYAGTTTNDYETGAMTLSATTGWETSDTQFNSAGQETAYATYGGAADSAGVDPYTGFMTFASNGAETSSEQFNSAGVETGIDEYAGTTTNDYETNAITLSATTGWETSDTEFNSSGQETTFETYGGAADPAGIDPEAGFTTFASNGAETSSEQFNSAGVETGIDEYAGTTTNDYETNAITLSATTGWETSDTEFNSSGQETAFETYGGTADSAGIDPEAGFIAFNASTGWEESDTEFNSTGQETAYETYAGDANPAGIDMETALSTYNPSTGWETSGTQFNSAGQETEYETYGGAADPAGIDPTAGLLTYASNGAETSSEQFNSAGAETGVDYYAGTTTNDYETNAISYSSTTGWEMSDTIYNPSGQVVEVENYAGSANTSDVDPETGITTYNPSTGAETGSEPGDGSGYQIASNPFSDGGYDGFSGSYGFAGKQSVVNAALGSDIGSIAQYDLSIGDQTGAAAAEAALHQAQEMANATPTAGTGTAVDSGSKWTGDAIAWSLGANMGSQYDTEVQQAFMTWAAASGLTFTEVSPTSPADIQIGFSDLNTPTSGVVGYTSYQASAGQLSAATIQLEDPGQDALVSGADGQPTYSGTNATLEQVLLHEIGHALGLADDSDQDSIMYYELTSSNQTLDSTDNAGIQSLYGSTGSVVQSGAGTAGVAASPLAAGQRTVDHQLTQLIAGMASFNPRSAGNTSLMHDDHGHQHMVLAASAH